MQDLERLWTRWIADLGWVDLSALTVVALFFLLGLCKGMVWQIGRAVALFGGYGAAVRFGPAVAEHVFGGAVPSYAHVYLAYVVVFLLAFALLSMGTRLLQAMVRRAGLGIFDRLGGGLFGVVTGGAVVVGLLSIVLMFGQRFQAYASVQESKAIWVSRAGLAVLGRLVPEPLQAAFSAPEPARIAAQPLTVDTPALDRLLRDAARQR